MRLTLFCHASTRAVRDIAFPLDEAIDAAGEAKAAAQAATVRRVDVAWTSPALRAQQTAACLGLDAAVAPALRDIDLGRWAGQTLAAVQEAEPEAVIGWMADAAAAPHGGESVVDVLGRVTPWLATLAHGEERVVAVTHAAVIRAAILIALDANPLSFWRIDVAPLCRASLQGRGGRWTLRGLAAAA